MCTDQAQFTIQNSSKQMSADSVVRGLTFCFTGGSIIMDYRRVFWFSNGLKLKRLSDGFVSNKHAAFHLRQ